MSWTLKHVASGITQVASAWGASDLVLRRQSLATDTLAFALDRTVDGSLPWAFDDTLQLFDAAGVKRFEGRVALLQPRGSGSAETVQCRVDGPWSFLEQTVYLQNWQTTNGSNDTLFALAKSRIIVGQNDAGAKIATGTHIAAALDFAIGSAGAALVRGAGVTGVTIPYSEFVDVTVAEFVRTLLRWTPDAVAWFDYATTVPTLHITRRGDLDELSLALLTDKVEAFGITPRNDLLVPGVRLIFEKTHSYNASTWTTHEEDTAGTVTPSPRLLVHTFTLEGSVTITEQQKIETAAIDISAPAFWLQFCPMLQGVPVGDLVSEAGSTSSEEEAIATPGGFFLNDDGPFGSPLPRLLTNGALAEWMGQRARVFTARTRLKYTGSDTALKARLGSGTYQTVTIQGRSTDATTHTYSRVISSTAAEVTPSGVAAALFAALSTLHYEGDLTTHEQECAGTLRPGLRLHLTDGRAEWATMGALVQQVEERLDAGVTNATFGPPAHLTPSDLVERLRTNRNARPTFRAAERSSGVVAGVGGTIEGGSVTAQKDTQFQTPGGGALTWRILTHAVAVAGVVPTVTEINTALAATYTDPAPDLVPANGDIVILTAGAVPKFIAVISTQAVPASGSFVRAFSITIEGVPTTFYALLWQCGFF